MKNIFLSLILTTIAGLQLSAQVQIDLEESIKAIKPNVYALILDITIPEGHILGAVPYALVFEDKLDTFSLTIELNKTIDYELVGRLKASHAPNAGHLSCGYSQKVSFVQLIKLKKDLPQNGLLLSGQVKYRMSNLQSSSHMHLQRVDKQAFRLRLLKETGLPKISVGHNCLTKEVYVP